MKKQNNGKKMLQVSNLTKTFGGLTALHDVTVHITESEILGLIGPNGSGKTTLFNCITGFYKPDGGKISFQGRDITGKKPSEVAKMGISRSFQITRPFDELTVFENMLISQGHRDEGIISTTYRSFTEEMEQRADELLKFVEIYKLRDSKASEISFGQRKLLELACTLMQNPDMVMLDEPAAGVNPTLIQKIVEDIVKANEKFGTTFLIIEHNMDVIMELSQRIYVLASGEILTEGLPKEVQNNPDVLEAYFGD
jgi:branched-chain amino acid transport system ATP-binding protein